MDCANAAPGKSLMQLAYEQATGQNVQYIEPSSGNHYAITDWNPVSAPHQVRNSTTILTDPQCLMQCNQWSVVISGKARAR